MEMYFHQAAQMRARPDKQLFLECFEVTVCKTAANNNGVKQDLSSEGRVFVYSFDPYLSLDNISVKTVEQLHRKTKDPGCHFGR